MKPNQLFTCILAATALLVSACSTQKVSQTTAIPDDVYGSVAQAREYKPSAPVQTAVENSSNTTDYYGTSDPRFDMDYSSRIDRFYYGNQNRNYYDPYYNYYGYNSYYSPYFSLNAYFGNAYSNFYRPYYNNYWSYYGSPYYNNYWGPYSYNNPYYYGGGFYGGGFYGGGYGGGYYVGRNDPNYGARPIRGSENGVNRGGRSGYAGNGVGGAPTRGNSFGDGTSRPRTEMYNPSNGTSGTRTNSTGSEARPSRGTSTNNDARPSRGTSSDARPTRNDAPSRPAPTYNPPPQQSSPPPSNSGGRSSGGSSGGGGGGRPTRGGR